MRCYIITCRFNVLIL